MTETQKQLIAGVVTAIIIVWLISLCSCASPYQGHLHYGEPDAKINNDGYLDGFNDGYDAAKLYGPHNL